MRAAPAASTPRRVVERARSGGLALDEVEPTTDHRITTSVTNTCGDDGERTQGAATRVMQWSVAPDENGLPWLTLTHEDGTVETYRRWTD